MQITQKECNLVNAHSTVEGDVTNMANTNQTKLFHFIHEVGFALDDVTLYLDTHPCDMQALAYYNNYKKIYKQAVDEYTKLYGPLTIRNVSTNSSCNNDYWTWVNTPWPWEGACR